MLTNTQLGILAVTFLVIILLRSFYKAIRQVVLNVYWHSQISGDDLDDGGYDINQENPWYPE